MGVFFYSERILSKFPGTSLHALRLDNFFYLVEKSLSFRILYFGTTHSRANVLCLVTKKKSERVTKNN